MLRAHGNADTIDVIGRACRLPGAADVNAFWKLLRDGRCAVSEIGDDRWSKFRHFHPRQGEPGKSYSFAAGVIDDIWGFDPAVFGISPREAEQMDPQQRLALQTVWEALEDAGIPPSGIAGHNVGVFVGASGLDYGTRRMFDPATTDAYFMTGNTLSLISNRISYIYDFNGPSFTVDTACSSSLVAMNEAVEALRAGRIDTAIVAGVNALLTPFPFIGFSAAHMLSPEGLCRPFDAAGTGYVRAEGCVALILQRRHAARVKGERSYGRIVHAGVNSDGRTVGVSLPSSRLQAELLTRVYEEAGVAPEGLAFVEAHGTGTRVGDPAEAQALGEVLGQNRTQPLPIGSVKSNIGHLEPASGVAGLLKALLAFEHDLLPASLHFDDPNPDIPFEDLNLKVAARPVELDKSDARAFAGVSTFGFGGTNAHVIVQRPEAGGPLHAGAADRNAQRGKATPDVVVISAQSQSALKALAENYRNFIGHLDDSHIPQLAAAVFKTREQLACRLALTGDKVDTLTRQITSFLNDDASTQAITARAVARDAPVAFVYSGNGSQWAGMGRDAFALNPTFRKTFREVDRLFKKLAGWSLADMLMADDLNEQLASTAVAQPLLFALQVALTRCLRAAGLEPAVVLGHSVGEIAAAHASNALSLKDAVNVIHKRSACQESARSTGTMAAVMLAPDDAAKLIADNALAGVEIAAINSTHSVTLSGPRDQIETVGSLCDASDIVCKLLDIDYPFHSALIDPVREPLLDALEGLKPRAAGVPFVSTVEGVEIEGRELDAAYWWRNVRQPVQFSDAVSRAIALGARVFVEIGPRAILKNYLSEICSAQGIDGAVVDNFHIRGRGGVDPVIQVLAQALASGARIDEDSAFSQNPRELPKLPHYPWQNQPFKPDFSQEANATLGDSRRDHPLIGWRNHHASPIWHTHIDPSSVPYLADHRVDGAIVVPGAAFVEMANAAGRQLLGHERIEIRDMDIVQPMMLDADHVSEVRLEYSADTGGFTISSRPRLSGDDWQLHAACRLAAIPRGEAPGLKRVRRKSDHNTADTTKLYARAEGFGLDYGPAFQTMLSVERPDKDTLHVWLAPRASELRDAEIYGLHPTILDGCFHGLIEVYPDDDARKAFIPVRFGAVRIYQPGCPVRSARLSLIHDTDRSMICDMVLFADDGAVVATLTKARFRRASLIEQPRLARLTYNQSVEMIGLPGSDHASPAPGISLIARRARSLSPANTPKDEEAKRLIEAAALRAAFDAVQAVNGGNTALDPELLVSKGKLDDQAQRQFTACLMVLEDASLARPRDHSWSIAAESGLPALDDILQTVLAEHPERQSECVLLKRAAGLLPAIFAGRTEIDEAAYYQAATVDYFTTGAPGQKAMIAAVEQLLAAAIDDWDRDRPVRILELGLNGGALTRALASVVANGRGRLIAADTSTKLVERTKVALASNPAVQVLHFDSDGDAIAALGPFDLLVSAGGLHKLSGLEDSLERARGLLAPGALVLVAEPVPDVFHDVVFGLYDSWFNRSASAEFPLGALRGEDEWQAAFNGAGFSHIKTLPLASDDGSAVLVLAKAETQVDIKPVNGDSAEPLVEAQRVPIMLVAGDDGDEGRLAEALETTLQNHKHPVMRVKPAASSTGNGAVSLASNQLDSWRDIIGDAKRKLGRLPEIIHLDGIAGTGANTTGAIGYRLASLIAMLQALGTQRTRTWLITPGAMRAVAGLPRSSAEQSAVWSFGRTAANEYSGIDFRLLDFDPALGVIDVAERVAAMIDKPGNETELLLRANSGYGLRIRRGVACAARQTQTMAAENVPGNAGRAAVLGFDRAGALDRLYWHSAKRRAPRPGEVEIEIAATGLNFRDVMWTLGMLPEEALEDGFAGPTLGFECSGRIVALGKGVKDLSVGDPVIAFAPACFASHVTVSARVVSPVPKEMNLLAAATIPVAFLTSYYALHHLARLKQDEWVLIHGGAGGVGLAALQIAQWCGAKIIATAGAEEKRQLLLMLGADYVFDSRSLDFYDQIMELTGGAGVDVVLNSLSGEAMERSIELVKPFGRFLELGKRDYYANTKIGLRPFRRNLSYFGIDADQLLTADARLAAQLFSQLVGLFDDGEFTALPYRTFNADNVVDACRLMQQSGHIGKILVTPPSPDTVTTNGERPGFKAAGEGIHLVVGGLGGFGLATADWLAKSGARMIVLTSRTGELTDEARAQIDRLIADDIDVRVEVCDVTDAKALATLLDALRELGPIKGVIHSAMVLDDLLIQNMDNDRIEAVLAPKVTGAEHLDLLTRSDPLDYFVLFSSIAALIGNPGQASYVAANGYLEGLARTRRAQGLPALAVGWGAITDRGYLARNAEVAELIAQRMGGIAFKAQDALAMLSELLASDDDSVAGAVVTVAPMDWSVAIQELAVLKTPPFGLISRDAGGAKAQAGKIDISALLASSSEIEARDTIAKYLAAEVASLLRLPDEDINLQRPLSDIGIDSLMLFELRTTAQQRLGLAIPIASIADGTTLSDIAARIVARAGAQVDGQPNSTHQMLAEQHIGTEIEQDRLAPISRAVEQREKGMGKIL